MKIALSRARTWASESRLGDFLELTKPSVTSLILMSTVVGFYMASSGSFDLRLMLHTLIGTGLIAASAAALNHCLEIESDSLMRRTAERPLPAGRLRLRAALTFAISLGVAGSVYMALTVNLLTTVVGVLTWASYLFLYTPLKRRTTLCTFIGAFPGAFPILMGWTAARNTLDPGGLVLCAMLFLWQFPHFYAIGWMYRDDYQRGKIHMLPVFDLEATRRQILIYSAVLLPVSLIPVWLGMVGAWYAAGAVAAGAFFFYAGWRLARKAIAGEARRLLKASIVYLPVVYVLLMLDKR